MVLRRADHVSTVRFYSATNYTLQSGSQLPSPVSDLTCVHRGIVLAHGSTGCHLYSTSNDLSIDCAFVHGNVKLLTGQPVTSVTSTSGSLWALSVDTLQIFGLPLVSGPDGNPMGAVVPLSNTCACDVNATADHNTPAFHSSGFSRSTHCSAHGVEDAVIFRENSVGKYSTFHLSSETESSQFAKQPTENASSSDTEQHSESVPSVLPKTSGRCSTCRCNSVPDLQTGLSSCCKSAHGPVRIQASADGEYVWMLHNNTLTRCKVEDQSRVTVFSLPGSSDTGNAETANATLYGDIACFEPALDSVWIGTSRGFLLIVSAGTGAVLDSFRPYEQQVTSLTLCAFTSLPAMISCGKSMNSAVLAGPETRGAVCRLSLDRKEVIPLGRHSHPGSSSKRKSKKMRAENISQAERVNEGHWIENNAEIDHVMLLWHVMPATNLKRMNKIRVV